MCRPKWGGYGVNLTARPLKMSKRKNDKSIDMGGDITPRKLLRESIPLMGAIFLAIASVVYILFRSWSNKLYFEKWKDYEDCGI